MLTNTRQTAWCGSNFRSTDGAWAARNMSARGTDCVVAVVVAVAVDLSSIYDK